MADNPHPRPEPKRPGGRRKPVPGEEWITTREGSPFWHFDFTIEGHRLRGSCGTAAFDAACSFVAKQHDLEWRRIKLGEKPPVHLTLNEAFAGWWQDKGKGTAYGEAGQRHQLARILRILGDSTRLADLDNPTVARLVRGLRAGEGVTEGHEKRSNASPATINRYLATLSVVCKWAAEVENAEIGPWTKKPHKLEEPEPLDRSVSKDAAMLVARSIVPHAIAPLILGFLTGARSKNWLLLRWEQVSLDLRRALVTGKGKGGGRTLALALSDDAVRLLERMQPDPEKRKGPVFFYGAVPCPCAHCSSALYRGDPIRSVKRSFKTAVRAAGIEGGMRIHDIRHSLAHWLLDQTGNLKVVQEALHHKDIKTTMRYVGGGDRVQPAIEATTSGMFSAPALLPAPTEKKEVA